MNIVIGSGNSRRVFKLPCGELNAANAKIDPKGHREGVATICALFKIGIYSPTA